MISHLTPTPLSLHPDVFIVSAKRTPFGTYGGVLKDHSATDLAEHASKAALAAGGVAPELVNSVIFGNVMQVCLKLQKASRGKDKLKEGNV